MVRAACGENLSMVQLAPVRAAAGGANAQLEGRVWSGSVTHVPLKADVRLFMVNKLTMSSDGENNCLRS